MSECRVEGCTKSTRGRKYCSMHQMRLHTTGSTGSVDIDPSKRRWTKDDLEFLKTHGRTMKTSEIAKHLGRSEQSVRTRAYIIDLPMRNSAKYIGGTRSKQEVAATKSPTLPDLNWAAGFLEGEGSFRWSGSSEQVTAKQVSREPLEKLQGVLGGAIHFTSNEKRRKQRPRTSDNYTWVAAGARARGIMMTLYSLLSTRRQQQIRTALSGAEASVSNT